MEKTALANKTNYASVLIWSPLWPPASKQSRPYYPTQDSLR